MKRLIASFLFIISWSALICITLNNYGVLMFLIVLAFTIILLITSSYAAPFIMSGTNRVLITVPGHESIPGKYHRAGYGKRHIFSCGIRPQQNHVFFNYLFVRDLPKYAVLFAMFHEYAHYKLYHREKILVLNVSMLCFLAEIVYVMNTSFSAVMIASVGFSMIWLAGMTKVRKGFEFSADLYAFNEVKISRQEMVKLLDYVSHNKKYSSTHPSAHKRMENLFKEY